MSYRELPQLLLRVLARGRDGTSISRNVPTNPDLDLVANPVQE
jgi:hypothetical protein